MKSPKIKKVNRKLLVKKLDAAFSQFIRAEYIKNYGNVCPFCRKRPIEVCFHFLSRVSHSTRWREDNVIASCCACNMEMEYSPAGYLLWFIDNRGRDKLDFLQALWHTTVKFSNYELELLTDEYKNKLKSIL